MPARRGLRRNTERVHHIDLTLAAGEHIRRSHPPVLQSLQVRRARTRAPVPDRLLPADPATPQLSYPATRIPWSNSLYYRNIFR